MPPKKNVPDGPKPKRVMTPEQLEKLAAAREKAKAVKDAMKSETDDHKIRILQAKMDAIKKTQKKPENPEPPPEPEPDIEPDPEHEPEPEPEPERMWSLLSPIRRVPAWSRGIHGYRPCAR